MFKSINGYLNYEVNELGEIRNTIKGNILKHPKDNYGYPIVNLYTNGKGKSHRVHRLVAIAFIENIQNKKEVNHKNGIKHDNRVENLEWCTASENMRHAFDNGLNLASNKLRGRFGANHNSSKYILQYTTSGEFIREWGSASDINRALNISNSSISNCCKGKYKSAGGFIWKFTC